MGATVSEEERFRQIADEFDRPTLRRVKRLVLRGSPPAEENLGPLATAYSAYLAGSVGDTRPNAQFWTLAAIGVLWAAWGAYKVFWTADVAGAVLLVIGLAQTLVFVPLSRREAKRARNGLNRSRSILGLEPLPDRPTEWSWRPIWLNSGSIGSFRSDQNHHDRHPHSVRSALSRIW
jgi:hypothetical protein